jgi:catechol 2,3-dioxygenase-like lactoylglutathione lyase family enzyme
MPIELNHTIVPCRDREASAAFLAEILGLPAPRPAGPFLAVELDNGVTLDFGADGSARGQHYAFLVDDPGHQRPMTLNERRGGHGCYFTDPSGHNLEIFTASAPNS